MTDSGYTGDVLVTAYSQFSRNRTFGTMLGRGYSVQAAHLEMNMVAEGYYASRCIAEMKQSAPVAMPVIDTTFKILYEKAPAARAFEELAAILC
jgi:glycerol-3-phosphate dehydrogenase (NAD(P)+)